MPRFFITSILFVLFLADTAPTSGDEKQVTQRLKQVLKQFNTPDAWAKRRSELRREFLQGARLWPLPKNRPAVTAIRHSRRTYDGYSVENVALETLPGFYCTGNLYRPLDAKKSQAAILCPHGHFRPLGRYRENHQIRCALFARMGATVFSYSMVGWQDSTQTTHDDPLVLALQTWNSIRALDWVSSLPGVDPDRLAITGASGGGTQTFFLAFLDDRIKASAPAVIVYPWKAPQGCKCEGGMPVMQKADTNAIELAAAVAPRAQLLLSVGNDPTKNFPKVGFPFIKQIYQMLGAGGSVENVHFAKENHDYGPSKRNEVYRFFIPHLKLEPLDEDLQRITIEKPEQMEVFNRHHPLPKHAVQGSQAVAQAFLSIRSLGASRPSKPDRKHSSQATYSFKTADASDEALIFTPPGFSKVGLPVQAEGEKKGRLEITVRDAATGKPTFCRVNVVGPDGNFYEPADNRLKKYSLTGQWPKWPRGWGNRPGKAPVRYFGRFFYSPGKSSLETPAGAVRVEVWKGFEYRPQSITTVVRPGKTKQVEIDLAQTAPMKKWGYYSGDPHIHIPRESDEDEQTILDLLEAEDIQFGVIMAYNEPAGPYSGLMKKMDSPQYRGLGKRSILSRGGYHILSGQEYRSGAYGHLNLFMLDHLVMRGQSFNANNWPVYGEVAKKAREIGGVAFYAHGGYAQEIYADVVQGNIDGVELLQFGVYRGIGLIDWYHMLSAGFRVPASGASDYPACRKLGDCKTYVYSKNAPDFSAWLKGASQGRSFVTTGPMLLLEVDGQRPGDAIEKQGQGAHRVTAKVRVLSETAPVTHVQLIVGGRIAHELKVPAVAGKGNWLELEHEIELPQSSWIAARAFSLSSTGSPDAEAHTNPVFVYINGKAPYHRESLDVLIARIDGQIAVHKKRKFAEQAKVLAYFERSRDILLTIRERGGAAAKGHPSDLAKGEPTLLNPDARTHSEEELKAFLKPVPPKPIEQVLESFETVGGFAMELVAKEPMVYDPIAAAFDEDGNLYVAEMRDYPYKPQGGQQPLGTVRLLRDTDHDGRFDESHVFADKLLWAAGVAPYRGGVFVAAPPDIWYLKDTDGDHRADVRRKVFSGFGTGNQQAMVNNLKWWLDHKIYGATAGNGGEVRAANQPGAAAISVKGSDFRFDPLTEKFETITGTIQFGNTFNDWGDRFVCSESQPLLHVVLPQRYLERNPFLPTSGAIQNIAPGPVPIFRISPIERWRQIRSSRRIAHSNRPATAAGASHHVVDAAAGVTIYRGGAYPPEFYGQVFVGDAQNNLIHRRRLVPHGATYKSQRVDAGTEFVRSSDNWFRPVNFVNAPDGTLYVLDMSREILEAIHIPLDVVKHLNLRSGRKHGRIYRLAPPNYRYPGPPRLSQASVTELVAHLESPHGFWRDTAHRLIYERQDKSAVAPLRKLLRHTAHPQTRLYALWSLRGLNSLSDEDLLRGMADQHPRVRQQAVLLSEGRLDASAVLLQKVISLIDDADPQLRFQVAFSLGESSRPAAATSLAKLARQTAGDRWMRTAVLSSVAKVADQMMEELLRDESFALRAGGSLLAQLATVVGARDKSAEVQRCHTLLSAHPTVVKNKSLQQRLILALGIGRRRTGKRLSTESDSPVIATFLSKTLSNAKSAALAEKAAEASRARAIQMLSCFPFEETHEVLGQLLDGLQPATVQIEALKALATYSHDRAPQMVLAPWRQYTPSVRNEAITAMLSRTAWTARFLRSAEEGEVSLASITPAQRSLLENHRDQRIRSLAKKVLGDSSRSRAEVIAEYRPVLDLAGDLKRGEQVFRRECMVCHRIGRQGHAVGPDLASSPSRDQEALLSHILDPSRYVLPQYEQYTLVDRRGRIFTGMIASQTATSITLKKEENKTETILRTQIEELQSTGKSLMPEGVEKKIRKQEMADLLAFLQASHKPAPEAEKGPKPLDIGTLPGLIEPK